VIIAYGGETVYRFLAPNSAAARRKASDTRRGDRRKARISPARGRQYNDGMTTTSSAVREQAGLLLTAGFVLCGSLRDVYFSRAFQAWSPLDVAGLTFGISTVLFLAIALAGGPRRLVALARWPREIAAINITSATAWIAFFYALQNLEPALVQVMWAGSGPLVIGALERVGVTIVEPVRLAALERWGLAAIGLMVVLAGGVAVLGLSATNARSATLGVGLTLLSGAAISINILLCKRLHERGVAPAPLLSVRFIGVVVVALVLAPFVRTGPSPLVIVRAGDRGHRRRAADRAPALSESARARAREPHDRPHRARRRARAGLRDPVPRGPAAGLAVVAGRDRRIFGLGRVERHRTAVAGRSRRAAGEAGCRQGDGSVSHSSCQML
jgi:drug/metabolite transporter (DMT)-like permease